MTATSALPRIPSPSVPKETGTLPPPHSPMVASHRRPPAAAAVGVDQADISLLPTPVKAGKLEALLTGYPKDKAEFLVNSFKFGFPIGFKGDRLGQDAALSRSAKLNPEVVSEKIRKEVQAGRIAGPFDTKPFHNFHSSPLGLVPKKNGDFRLIHNLSYTENPSVSPSVNEGIPRELATVQYAGVDDAVRYLKKLGRNAFQAKIDILQAFRQCPIRPSDYCLLGFTWRGKYYYDRCMPMGASSSCKNFEAFSTALEWILINKYGVKVCCHCLDDFWTAHETKEGCARALRQFLTLCADLGIPIAHEKTVGPTQILTFLGIELDSTQMELRLPEDKIVKCVTLLQTSSRRKKMTLREIQSLIGSLSFACVAVTPGRAFLRRLIQLTIGVKKPHFYVSLNSEARADMACWLEFLQHFNGKNMFVDEAWITSAKVQLFTDSAPYGYGAVMGSRWFHGTFPPTWQQCNIVFLELVPIVIALFVWGRLLSNHSLHIFTDNEALVAIINKQCSTDTLIMKGIRKLVIACMTSNICIRSSHVSGVSNSRADALSRGLIAKFKLLSPQSRSTPTIIPDELLPPRFIQL